MTYKRLFIETTFLFLTITAVLFILDKYGFEMFFIDEESIPFAEEFEQGKYGLILASFLTVGLIVSGVEELIFRLLPYKVYKKYLSKTPYWVMGVITASLFAFVHTNLFDDFEFPLAQFMLGMYLWKLIRLKDGYNLAFVSHYIYNIYVSLLVFGAALIEKI